MGGVKSALKSRPSYPSAPITIVQSRPPSQIVVPHDHAPAPRQRPGDQRLRVEPPRRDVEVRAGVARARGDLQRRAQARAAEQVGQEAERQHNAATIAAKQHSDPERDHQNVEVEGEVVSLKVASDLDARQRAQHDRDRRDDDRIGRERGTLRQWQGIGPRRRRCRCRDGHCHFVREHRCSVPGIEQRRRERSAGVAATAPPRGREHHGLPRPRPGSAAVPPAPP